MKLGCSLGTKTFKYSKVERPAYNLHHCAVYILGTDIARYV